MVRSPGGLGWGEGRRADFVVGTGRTKKAFVVKDRPGDGLRHPGRSVARGTRTTRGFARGRGDRLVGRGARGAGRGGVGVL